MSSLNKVLARNMNKLYYLFAGNVVSHLHIDRMQNERQQPPNVESWAAKGRRQTTT